MALKYFVVKVSEKLRDATLYSAPSEKKFLEFMDDDNEPWEPGTTFSQAVECGDVEYQELSLIRTKK